MEAGAQVKLLIKYIPGVPDYFSTSFQIQVAHFEPDVVNLTGEGVFPRISLDLPRIWNDEGHYEKLLSNARDILTKRYRDRQRMTSLMTVTDGGGELISGDEQCELAEHHANMSSTSRGHVPGSSTHENQDEQVR